MQEFGSGSGYLKAGLLGFAGSGKTYTATLLALELNKRLGGKSRIALFDTETGGEYINDMVREATGKSLVGAKSRAFVDLMTFTRECESGAANIAIVDSVTHVWREVCDAYLSQLNAARSNLGRSKQTRLEFKDWQVIKPKWAEWTDLFLNSELHIIICGRAGYEWDFEENEDTGKKELIKTGIKMKVEGEFGYEPSLLINMTREQNEDKSSPNGFRVARRAMVLKDRFAKMDGAVIDNPGGASFAPHLDMLRIGASNTVDVVPKTPMDINEAGEADWHRERRQRAILCEKIQAEIVKAYPGQTAAEKKAKVAILESAFGTTSWTEVENTDSGKLASGLEALAVLVANVKPGKPGKEE